MIVRALLIHPLDNVGLALEDIPEGSIVSIGVASAAQPVTAREFIPFAHKIAIKTIADGDLIVKYGAPVGCATAAIEPGAWVHSHNVRSRYARPSEKIP